MKKLVLLAVLAIFAGSASANLLVNPGFEFANGSLHGWSTWDAKSFDGAWGTDYAGDVSVSTDAATGLYSALMDGDTASGFAQQFGIYQVVYVTPGTEVELTGMWKGDLGTNGWAELKLGTYAPGASFNMDGNKQYAAKIDTYGPINERTNGAWDWESTELAPLSGNTIVSEGMVVVYTQVGGWGSASTLLIDDMVLEVVPEPTTMALLGLGGLGLIRRKRS